MRMGLWTVLDLTHLVKHEKHTKKRWQKNKDTPITEN